MDADDTPTPAADDHITLASRAEAFAELADLNDDPDAGSTGEVAGATPDVPSAGTDDEAAPPVVVVVVVHNADEWLDETLVSLDRQTYTNLSVLIIDAASDIDPTPRVARVLPGAFVRRLESNVGFGPTVNEVLELVSGASFYCVCHDDVALDPDCVHELVAEAFRSNAGIVGPKLVAWDDPDELSSVGFTIDRSGGRAPYAEAGELDQGQHDAVRDVFAVSGGCTLVRSDLFTHLGGFDPDLDLIGEDLDLCWRAHLVGARVVVAPQARARHREALADRLDAERLVRVDAAHRLRTVLSNYRLAHMVLLVPLLVIVSLVEAITELMIGRPGHARAQIRAWGTNLRAAPAIGRARRRVHALRERNDRTISRLQTRTWARLDGLVQAHRRVRARQRLDGLEAAGSEPWVVAGGADDSTFEDAERDSFVRTGAPRRSYSFVAWGIVGLVAVLIVGSRGLFFGSLPMIGTFAAPPASLSAVWHTWLGSWNPAGLGSVNPPPAALGPLALVGSLFGGAFDFIRRIAILAPIPIGLWGAWRLPRAFGSRRAQFVTLVLYATVPVPWNALSQGVWSGLVVYAFTPWLLAALFRALRAAPFVAGGGGEASARGARRWAPVLGLGLLLGIVGAFVPAFAAVAVVVAIGLAVGSLLLGRPGGVGRLLVTTVGAVVVAAVLLVPWTLVGPARSLWSLAGVQGGVHGWLDLPRVLRFQSGPIGSGLIGYVFLVAAALPLVIGRSWRFAWGLRAWTVAGACFAVVWCGQQDWFALPTPPPEVFLAPAAASLAFAAACGAVAVEADLPAFRFGWAQVAAVVAAAAVVLSVFPLLGNATDGRWKMAPVGLDQALDFLAAPRGGQPSRVVWIADPQVMPVAGWRLDDRSMLGVSHQGAATIPELWAPAQPDSSSALIDALNLARNGQTTRLGRILADMDVRYVILPRQIVPLPYHATAHPIPADLLAALDDQLDLSRMPANDAVVAYHNEAWRPGARLYPPGTGVGSSVADALDAGAGRPVRGRIDPTRTSSLTIPEAGILATGQPADPSWRLVVNGKPAKSVTLWGWEQGFEVTGAGTASLSRPGGGTRLAVLGFMGLLWIAAIALWVIGRRTGSDDDLVAADAGSSGGSGTLVRVDSDPSHPTSVEVAHVQVGESVQGDIAEADTPEDDGTVGNGTVGNGTVGNGTVGNDAGEADPAGDESDHDSDGASAGRHVPPPVDDPGDVSGGESDRRSDEDQR